MENERAHLLINDWSATYIKHFINNAYGKKTTYLLQIKESGFVEIIPGQIVNDFLCLGRLNKDIVELNKRRLDEWLVKYDFPFVSCYEEGTVIDSNNDILVNENDNFYPAEPTFRKGSVLNLIEPNLEFSSYFHAVKARLYEIALYAACPQISLPPVDVKISCKVDSYSNNTIYTFEKDIFPLIMFDLFTVFGKYKLRNCPQCNALFLPINRRIRCAGGCKPTSRLNKKELEDCGIKSFNLSNNKARAARIKQLKRQGHSLNSMNYVLNKEGFKIVRNYIKKDSKEIKYLQYI